MAGTQIVRQELEYLCEHKEYLLKWFVDFSIDECEQHSCLIIKTEDSRWNYFLL